MPDESKIPSWHSILQKEVEALGKAILAIRANRAAPIVYGSLPSDTFGSACDIQLDITRLRSPPLCT
ncbi:hypothetical protein F442_09656 [Phytophthora nicotianae P10297]|uniref:Uncharacterized protein n=2 Tax=Phytophthora nicotianae TaxID=4792 RepID=W2Z8G4_PHYNI|nr:hypothetical protein F444_09852 [Phytophthora nicotianae P1976]ETP43662.1 hypothetical protein F442_09656 [Phytophthora nicotianae P10297]